MEVLKMEQTKQQEIFTGPWALPIVRYETTMYFADLRLQQFRDVSNPHNYVEFDSEKGKQMCEQGGVVVCRECRMCAIISTALQKNELRCMNCLAKIVPKVRL